MVNDWVIFEASEHNEPKLESGTQVAMRLKDVDSFQSAGDGTIVLHKDGILHVNEPFGKIVVRLREIW